MDVSEEFDEQAADRLLTGELSPDDVAPGYRRLADALSAARAGPSAAELSRRADTVRAMTAARRGTGEAIGSSEASWPRRMARRRNVRMGALAAAATLSLTTGLAAAGVLPGPLQSIASRVLPSAGDSSSDMPGKGGTVGPPEASGPQSGPGPGAGSPEGDEGFREGPTPPAGAKAPSPQSEAKTSPGQAKQAAKDILRADATAAGGRLVVSFEETGIGADAVTLTARADATATYGCVSQDGKEKTRREARVSGLSEAGSRFGAVNGKAGGGLTLTAPGPAGVSCPSGATPQLIRVMYSRVVVLDTTTGASTTINRTFSTAI